MKKNDRIELTIEDISAEGAGVGKWRGPSGDWEQAMTFFVKDTLTGDRIRAVITKLKKTYGYARLTEVLEPSPYRVEPLCPLHKKCGGCQIQALSYEKQLEYKENKVRNSLMRIGGFSAEQIPMEPIIGMKEPFYYRNKAQFPVGRDKNGKLAAGFYAARTHDMIPVQNCYLGVSQNREVLECVLSWMEQYGIEPYDEKTGSGLIRHILVRYGFRSRQIMVCIVVNAASLPKAKELTDRLSKIEGMTSVSISVNTRRDNVIMGDTVKTLWGRDYIEDEIGNIKFQISPLSFYQVNPVQTEVLYRKVLEFAGLSGKETVWDLYCGIGTISLFLAGQAKKVYGIEIVPQAVEDARRNARINGIGNAEFFVGEAEAELERIFGGDEDTDTENRNRGDGREEIENGTDFASRVKERPQAVVVDPPRKGCSEKLLEAVVKAGPERIVYVSCEPGTLARDLKYLCGRGYVMERVQAVDQFCQTVHVETVVLLTHEKPTSYIEVTMDYDTIVSEYKPKVKVTYKMIIDYIQEKYNINVKSTTIAEVKRSLGLEVGDYNRKDGEINYRKQKITPERQKAVEEALRHFGIIE